MAAPRKIFRIEQTEAAWSAPPNGGPNDARDPVLNELRALLASAAASANSGVTRLDGSRRPAFELRQVIAAICGPQEERLADRVPSAAMARLADELQAAVRDSETAAHKILTAAETIDQAAKSLAGLLKRNFERGLTQDIRHRVTQIFEACHFHDLTSQRVAKVRASIDSLDRDITRARALDELACADAAPPPYGPRLGDDPGHASQGDIDSLFDGDVNAVCCPQSPP